MLTASGTFMCTRRDWFRWSGLLFSFFFLFAHSQEGETGWKKKKKEQKKKQNSPSIDFGLIWFCAALLFISLLLPSTCSAVASTVRILQCDKSCCQQRESRQSQGGCHTLIIACIHFFFLKVHLKKKKKKLTKCYSIKCQWTFYP